MRTQTTSTPSLHVVLVKYAELLTGGIQTAVCLRFNPMRLDKPIVSTG